MNQRELTAKFEGLRLKPYRCPAGKLTIGYGHNIDAKGLPAEFQAYLDQRGCITQQMADWLLDHDLADASRDLHKALPWVAQLSANRQMVLTDMCFNMGIGNSKHGLLSFANTLNLVRAGKYEDAAKHMAASAWARETGYRADLLSDMMRIG